MGKERLRSAAPLRPVDKTRLSALVGRAPPSFWLTQANCCVGTYYCICFRSSLTYPQRLQLLTLYFSWQLTTRNILEPRAAAIKVCQQLSRQAQICTALIAAMALDAPLAALERHCGLARGHGRFFLNAGAFIGLMVVSNALEEELYTNLPGFDYFKAVACLELGTFAAAALLAERRSGLKTPRKAPLAFYAVLGASMALSQTLGKLANKYVNFTVSTIFKCSKALTRVEINQAVMGSQWRARLR